MHWYVNVNMITLNRREKRVKTQEIWKDGLNFDTTSVTEPQITMKVVLCNERREAVSFPKQAGKEKSVRNTAEKPAVIRISVDPEKVQYVSKWSQVFKHVMLSYHFKASMS